MSWLAGSGSGRPLLRGRDVECRQLDQVVDAVHGGASRALVIRGEAGIGKSALLDYLVAKAARCAVVRACGIQAEAKLAFAGLHQLCTPPALDRLDHVPPPQREALCIALGLRTGGAPDPFLLGLAVLRLLSQAASERPRSARSMTRSGSTGRPPTRSVSWLGGWRRSRSRWCSRFASR